MVEYGDGKSVIAEKTCCFIVIVAVDTCDHVKSVRFFCERGERLWCSHITGQDEFHCWITKKGREDEDQGLPGKLRFEARA